LILQIKEGLSIFSMIETEIEDIPQLFEEENRILTTDFSQK
jgi:hypothetical protein